MSDHQPDIRRYEQAKAILQQALDLAPAQRSAYVDRACKRDQDLRAEVLSLLAAHDEANSSFLDSPVALDADGPDHEDDEELDLSGKRVGAYRVERLLGRGGMGAVYFASRDDGEFSKHVAIKFIRPSIVTPSLLKRFRAERQILADIDHPHIARLIDGGTADGNIPFFIMDYVPGETLAQTLVHGPLPAARATRLATEIAAVLEVIHAKGLVFRDLKPSNIMITADGAAKVLDFGIAKIMSDPTSTSTTTLTLTQPGSIVGSPRYMSPEQATGERVDARSDVFSFGILMFEVLTGRLPFAGDTRRDYIKNLLSADATPLPSAVPAGLRTIVERCLRKTPTDRFASGKELADALRSVAAPPVTGISKRALWSIITAAAAIAVVVSLWLATRPTPAEPVALKGPAQLIATWASTEKNPRISPDLRWVSFISDRDGDMKIFMIDRKTSEERSLVPLGGELRDHEWSPSGDRIAYTERLGKTTSLVIAPVADGRPRVFELTQVDPVLVRWIGEGIYYLSDGSLWRFDLGAERAREITTARGTLRLRSADVSTDETRIVFTALDDSPERVSSIWVAGMDASTPSRLTEERMDPRSVRWRRKDTREVVYVSGEGGMSDVWLLDVPSRKRQHLTVTDAREGAIELSNNGELLAYEQIREEAHLATCDPAESKPAIKALTSDSRSDLMPDASSSGDEVVFQRSTTFDMSMGTKKNTILLNRDQFHSPPERLAEGGYAPSISPNGLWVAYSVLRPEAVAELWIEEVQSRHATLATNLLWQFPYTRFPFAPISRNLAWSPQGSRLFFLARGSGDSTDIVSAELSSGKPIHLEPIRNIPDSRLSDLQLPIADVQVSRDGSNLSYLFRSAGRGVSELHVVFLTRKEDKVTFTEKAEFRLSSPGWTDDGAVVVLRSDQARTQTEVLLVKAGSVKEAGRLQNANLGSFVLDPRRRVIYFTRTQGQLESVQAFSLDTGQTRTVVQSEPHGPAFSGIRVLDNGQLLFSLQAQNYDILSNEIGK